MDYLDEVKRAALPDPHDERDVWCGPELRWCINEIETLRQRVADLAGAQEDSCRIVAELRQEKQKLRDALKSIAFEEPPLVTTDALAEIAYKALR